MRTRKLAVFAGAALLAGGVGVAVASQGDGQSGSQAAMSQPGGMPGQGAVPGQDGRSGGMPGGPPGTGGPGAMDLSGLADELGVTTDALRDALQNLQPTPRGNGADPLVAALAQALDLSEAKVQAALGATTAATGSTW